MHKSTLALAAAVLVLSAALLSIPFLYSHASLLHASANPSASPVATLHVSPVPSPSPLGSPSPSPSPSLIATTPTCTVPDNPIRPRAYPCLVATTPSGDTVSVTSLVTLNFSQPMDHMSVESSFLLTPSAYGLLSWTDDFTLNFRPYRFIHATTYTVSIGGHSVWERVLHGQKVWHFTTSAGPPLVLAPGAASLKVPILMYHYIRNNPAPRDILGYNLSVTPSDFAAQMAYLDSHGYHTITLDDLAAYLNGSRGLPSHPIVLTFDDGYVDFYTAALPVLLAHDFTAVSYVVPGFWGDASRYMTPDQVLVANHSGIQIGSHTVNHVNLTNSSASGLAYQLSTSKSSLESLLGHPVLSFCYPSGRFDSRVEAAVQNAGYRDATTTQYGAVRALASRYIWGRLRISGGESLSTYASSVAAASY